MDRVRRHHPLRRRMKLGPAEPKAEPSVQTQGPEAVPQSTLSTTTGTKDGQTPRHSLQVWSLTHFLLIFYFTWIATFTWLQSMGLTETEESLEGTEK